MANQVWLGQSLWRLPPLFTTCTTGADYKRVQILVRRAPLAMANQVWLGELPRLRRMHEPTIGLQSLVRLEPLVMANQVWLGQLRRLPSMPGLRSKIGRAHV